MHNTDDTEPLFRLSPDGGKAADKYICQPMCCDSCADIDMGGKCSAVES